MVMVKAVGIDREAIWMIAKSRLVGQPNNRRLSRNSRPVDTNQLRVIAVLVIGANMMQYVDLFLNGHAISQT